MKMDNDSTTPHSCEYRYIKTQGKLRSPFLSILTKILEPKANCDRPSYLELAEKN